MAAPSTCLSVAIRTMLLEPDFGRSSVTLGVGGGIIADSTAEDEYAETLAKLRFVNGLDPGFTLFETMLVTERRQVPHLDDHAARMQRSAKSLGFAFDLEQLRREVGAALQALDPRRRFRLRIDLRHDGVLKTASTAFEATATMPARVMISERMRPRHEASLSMHKTSARRFYDDALERVRRLGFFDMLFFNPSGQITEGTRSSVFAFIDGRWVTPRISDGALPGTARSRLLRQLPAAVECSVTVADLLGARQLLVCNALHGALSATFETPRQPVLQHPPRLPA
jgi:para-aminobenzoate synthetase/4-amino-4-deoxychorismate lyase